MGTDDLMAGPFVPDGDTLAQVALDAGAVIMRIYESGCDVESKADDSPVTIADQQAEALILARLKIIAPDLPVLAEEEVAAGRIPELGRVYACVDPLDGTREFVNRNRDFTVNIAIIRDGRPVAGVIYAPAHGALYVAADEDHGWWAHVPVGASLPAIADRQPLRIRSATNPPCAVASRSHRTEETDTFLSRYCAGECVSAGSSLKFCLIATGEADIYPRFGRTMEWDTAAGQAIVQAAGGKVLTLDGAPLGYGKVERGYDNPHFVVYGGLDPQ